MLKRIASILGMSKPKKSKGRASLKQAWAGNSWVKAMFGSGSSLGLSGYFSTDSNRKVGDPIPEVNGTANDLLRADVYTLTRQLRHLERNNATIRSIVEGHLADNVGTGIGVVPDTGDESVNERIRQEWERESDILGICGESDTELQRLWCREIDISGNLLARIIQDDSRTPLGLSPIAILPLELEWLSREPVGVEAGNSFCAGIEFDRYGRPVAYHLCDPNGDGVVERVPAKWILHGFERKRAQMAIGEPRLCSVIERSLQRGRLIDTELKSAINASALSTFLKSGAHEEPSDDGDTDSQGNPIYMTEFPVGAHANLAPGDDIGVIQTTRPNMEVQEFAKAMDGDLAGAAQVSRIWLTRDGSAYNFANSKFDQIRTNMVVRPWQLWFGRIAAGRVYEYFLPYILNRLGLALKPEYRRYKLQPDVPQETDEKASAQALETSLKLGVTTRETYCSQRGQDWRKIAEQLALEQQTMEALGVKLGDPAPAPAPPVEVEDDEEDPEPKEDPKDEEKEEARAVRAHTRNVELARAGAPSVSVNIPASTQPAPVVNIRNDLPAPVVTVAGPAITVEPSPVTVINEIRQEPQSAPVVNVTVPQQAAPVVNVMAAPAAVVVENTLEVPARTIRATQQKDGSVLMEPQE